jgi:hypothetical protein
MAEKNKKIEELEAAASKFLAETREKESLSKIALEAMRA